MGGDHNEELIGWESVSKLVFYAQSTSAVRSGRGWVCGGTIMMRWLGGWGTIMRFLRRWGDHHEEVFGWERTIMRWLSGRGP